MKRKAVIQSIVAISISIATLALVFQEQASKTVDRLKYGPKVAAVVGRHDRVIIDKLEKTLEDNEIVLTFAQDGSTYAFMYSAIPATAGLAYNAQGEPSDLISFLYTTITDLCGNPEVERAFREENITAIIFGNRLLGWGGKGWNFNDLIVTPGLNVIDVGEHLLIAEPDFTQCAVNES